MRPFWLVAFCLCGTVHAQDPAVWRFWRMADGLYESFAQSITASSDGTLWVTHGVNVASVMDGYGIRHVTTGKELTRIFKDPGGWAWAPGTNGFHLWWGTHWTTQEIPNLGSYVKVQPEGPGKALVLEAGQLLEYDFAHNALQILWVGKTSRIGSFTDMRGDFGQGLWITGQKGIGRLRRLPTEAGAGWEWIEFHQWPLPLGNFRYPYPGQDGEVFATATVGATDGDQTAVLHYDSHEWKILRRTRKPESRAWRGADDTVWIKDGSILYRQQGDRIEKIERKEVFSSQITDVAQEPGGVFWLATYDGLVRSTPPLWRTPAGARGIDSTVFSVADDRKGGLWFLSTVNLTHLQGGRWETIAVPRQWTPLLMLAQSLVMLRDGSMLARCPGGKLLRFDPRTRAFAEIAPPAGHHIQTLAARGDGTAWVVTRVPNHPGFELGIYDHGLQPRMAVGAEWDSSEVRTVRQTSDGAIWFGGPSNLGVYEHGRFRIIGHQAGYPDSGAFSIREVRPGKLWIGGRSKLIEFDGRQWKVLRDSDRARTIVPARDGTVWVAASDGVYQFKDGVWLNFGVDDGLASSICYSVHEDPQGGIWVGATLGLSRYHPEADRDPPEALIPESRNLRRLSPGEVRLTFSGRDKWEYTSAERLLYSYRIDEGPWSAFELGNSAVYRQLGSGNHRFEVRAMDRSGNVSPRPAVFDFSIAPFWWAQPGFLASAAFGATVITVLLLLVAANYRNRGRLIEQLRVAHRIADKEREEAERANRSKGQFLANMSHEIRTPMNGVMGMAELALEAEAPAERQEYLRSLQQCARSLLTILNDILDFSKIEAGKIDLAREGFSVRECLSQALQPLAVRAGQKNVELICRVAPAVPDRLMGDQERLRQVMINLVGNAVKFTDRGEVGVQLTVEDTGGDEVGLQFLVYDTGIGIPEEKRQLIFQPFEQADGSTTRRFGGTGLGLPISAKLVEMMGGHIQVESPWTGSSSQAGPGAAFHFSLRFETEARRPMESTQADSEVLEGVPVLIVDDNANSRSVLGEILSQCRMKTEMTESAAAAWRMLEAARLAGTPFQVAIVDRSLPDVDGLELAGQMRRNPDYPGLQLVVLDSPGWRPRPAGSADEPVDAVLYKPIRDYTLIRTVAGLLTSHPGKRPAPAQTAPLDVSPRYRSGLRILVAEDNPVNQKVARRFLEKRGHSVATASDGKQALAALERERFDLVLMDVQMPEMDGYEATVAIRRRERETGAAHLPIIALTAHAMKGDQDRCLAAGMDGYVSKPIDVRELDATIERLMAAGAPVG